MQVESARGDWLREMIVNHVKEFTVIKINLNTVKKNDEEHSYNKDNLYLELNNIGYYSII